MEPSSEKYAINPGDSSWKECTSFILGPLPRSQPNWRNKSHKLSANWKFQTFSDFWRPKMRLKRHPNDHLKFWVNLEVNFNYWGSKVILWSSSNLQPIWRYENHKSAQKHGCSENFSRLSKTRKSQNLCKSNRNELKPCIYDLYTCEEIFQK